MMSKSPVARAGFPVPTEARDLDLSRWPRWIAEALAYKPESPAAVVDSPAEAFSPVIDDRRNIRVLTRVPNFEA